MDWEKYEEVVKDIYKALGKKSGIEIVCHGRSCKCTGKSQVEHQIDVITKHSDGIHNYKTAIECKYWDKKINKDIAMKVGNIVTDCNFDKGVIVSKKGATPDGKQYAKHTNIELVELRKPLDKDWEGRIKNIEFQFRIRMPELVKIENIEASKHSYQEQTIIPQECEYILPDNSRIGMGEAIKEVYDEKLDLENIDEIQILKKEFPAKTKLRNNLDQKEHKTRGFKLHVKVNEIVETQEIRGEDHVWLIMKNVFEDKRYVISKTGEIRETE